MAFATYAAQRGHKVHLYDAASEIGGQFNMAKRIPGKEEFYETLRYFSEQIKSLGVHLHLENRVGADTIIKGGFDHVVLATGVTPRIPEIEGINHPKVLLYTQILKQEKEVGHKVALIGAGGIGFDVAEYLTQGNEQLSLDIEAFAREWGLIFLILNQVD